MGSEDEALASWEERLRRAEADLLDREQQAMAGEATPQELVAFAAERDRIARDRDTLAQGYDDRAVARDVSALDRDVAGSTRDRLSRGLAQDEDVAFWDRFASGEDRDLAAGDRSDSLDDRRRGRAARSRAAVDRDRAADDRDAASDRAEEQVREVASLRAALDSRLVIGQAQGLLMARHRVSATTAFRLLVRLSQESNTKLRHVAADIVAAAEADWERVPEQHR